MSMLDHFSFEVSELARSAAFYDAVMAPLGYVRVWTHEVSAGLNAALSPALITVESVHGLHRPADAGLAGRRPNLPGETPQQAAGKVSAFKEAAVGYGRPGADEEFAIRERTQGIVVPGDGFHLAFKAPSRDAVLAFHRAALAHGGRDNGGAGVHLEYGPHYFAAFVFDPDGHRIEAVIHGPA